MSGPLCDVGSGGGESWAWSWASYGARGDTRTGEERQSRLVSSQVKSCCYFISPHLISSQLNSWHSWLAQGQAQAQAQAQAHAHRICWIGACLAVLLCSDLLPLHSAAALSAAWSPGSHGQRRLAGPLRCADGPRMEALPALESVGD